MLYEVITHSRIILHGGKALAATCYCSIVVIVAFVLPVIQLAFWVVKADGTADLPVITSYSIHYTKLYEDRRGQSQSAWTGYDEYRN